MIGDATVCLDCARSLWHCHDVLILHESLELECPSVDCAARIELHTFFISCREIEPPCGC